MPAFHMVELLDASMRGMSSEELLRRKSGGQSRIPHQEK
jgi:hypothetical protein